MILKNRRQRSIYLALAAMDVAVLLPFVLTWIARIQHWDEFPLAVVTQAVLVNPLALFLSVWLLMVGYMLIVDLLDKQGVESPQREYIVLALVIFTSLAGIRVFLYPSASPGNLGWLRDTARSIFNFSDGVLPPLLLVLVNAVLWIRVAMSTDREMGFFRIGVSLRLGMLLSLLGGLLLTTIGGYTSRIALIYFVLFFGFGLFAVAVARIDEKAVGIRGSQGATIPVGRLTEIAAYIGLIFGISYIVDLLLNPTSVRKVVAFLDPLWSAIGWVVSTIFVAVILLIGPFFDRLMLRLEQWAANAEPVEMMTEVGLPGELAPLETATREWIVLRYCLVIGAIILVLAVIWFFLLRLNEGKAKPTEEEVEPETDEFIGKVQPVAPRFSRLRDWLSFLRKYGLSQRFLDAITVENMYANVTRLAGERGYPRPISQPPDIYLRTLFAAFPAHDEQLYRLTAAYMRAHYGDMEIDSDELAVIREDYRVLLEFEAS